MKILMFIDTIGRHGGAESQFVGLAKLLREKSYAVEVLSYHSDDGYLNELENHNIKVNIVKLGNNRISKIFNARKVINLIAPDIVIGFKDGANVIASCLKFLGAKWKLIVGERSTSQSKNAYSNLKFYSYKFADAIVPNSQSQREYIITNYPHLLSKVCVITNFTDTDKYKPSPKEISTKTQRRKLIVVGRISPEKNTLSFIHAVYRVAEKSSIQFSVDWFGYTTVNEYLIKCKKEIERLQLESIFHFHSPVENINEVYPQYDISCLPSLYEGFPNAICESMSCGLPILASDVCDNRLIVEDSINGFLFDPNSVEKMTEVINRMLNLKTEDLRRMGEKSRDIALEKFCSDTFINKYTNLINDLQ